MGSRDLIIPKDFVGNMSPSLKGWGDKKYHLAAAICIYRKKDWQSLRNRGRPDNGEYCWDN
jgi:hypothetical protein